jgi:hypothetical protein
MSNRSQHNNRTTRLPILTENDRILLNIYLNMYNQTVRDIELSYQQINLLYENLDSIRNIINIVTGVTSDISNTQTEQEPASSTFG